MTINTSHALCGQVEALCASVNISIRELVEQVESHCTALRAVGSDNAKALAVVITAAKIQALEQLTEFEQRRQLTRVALWAGMVNVGWI